MRKIFILILIVLCSITAIADVFIYQSGLFEIDIPDGISFRYYTPEKQEGFYAGDQYSLVLSIKKLQNYLYGEDSRTYLSPVLYRLCLENNDVQARDIISLLQNSGQKFILNKPNSRYDIESTYEKKSIEGKVIGESYFGMIGDGGFAPSGYHFHLSALVTEYVITVSFVLNDESFDVVNSNKEYFTQGRNNSWQFRNPSAQYIKDFSTKIKDYNSVTKINNFNSLWKNIVESIRLNSKNFDRNNKALGDVRTYGYLNDSNVRLRDAPNLHGKIIGSLDKGQRVKVISRTKEEYQIGEMRSAWYQVQTSTGEIGWAFGYFIDVEQYDNATD